MKYAVRRILALFITMILVSFLAFAAFHIISGDPARAILGMNATEKQLEMLRHELGLDKPFIVQYINWLLGFFSGNLGISYSYRQPVASLLAPKLKVTLLMVLISFAIIVIFSLPLGLRAAQKSGSRFEWIRTTINQLCMAVPAFFLSILISYVFGIILKVFTPGDFPKMERNLPGALRYLFFAAVCIAIPRIAMAVRMLKSTLIEEMEKEDEFVLAIALEGTRKPVKKWKTGYHLIAKEVGCPVYMGFFDWGTKRVGKGEIVTLTDDARADTERIQMMYEQMHLKGKHPENYITH